MFHCKRIGEYLLHLKKTLLSIKVTILNTTLLYTSFFIEFFTMPKNILSVF